MDDGGKEENEVTDEDEKVRRCHLNIWYTNAVNPATRFPDLRLTMETVQGEHVRIWRHDDIGNDYKKDAYRVTHRFGLVCPGQAKAELLY